MPLIETVQLTKRFGERTIVNSVTLTVQQNEIFGFLGKNGAGKSTFINMLTGIVHPSSGTIRLFDGDGNTAEWKRRIGVLPDYSTFYDSLTARDHLLYLSRVKGIRITKKECDRILEEVGLAEHAGKRAKAFSFGMKKKLGIAQALLGDPELLFLDEPTSGVDVESSLQIQQLLLRLQKEGRTIFMTSHNLHEIEKICTCIAIMKAGTIAAAGSLSELQAKHRSWRTVTVRHAALADKPYELVSFVEGLGKHLEWREEALSLEVDDKRKVAALIRAFVHAGVDIYHVCGDEPSLERIFLEE